MNDDLRRLPYIIRLSRKKLRIIKANITFEDHEDTVEIPATPNPDPTPEEGEVTLQLPEDVTYSIRLPTFIYSFVSAASFSTSTI